MSCNAETNAAQQPEDVKPILHASFGTPLTAESLQLSSPWPRDPLSHVPLAYMLNANCGFERSRWRLAYVKNPEAYEEAYERYIRNKKEFFLIPGTLECDRVFLRDRADAAYVEATARYLRGESSVMMPILTAGVWKYPTVGSLDPIEWARNSAIGAAEASAWYERVISPADWVTFCKTSNHGSFSGAEQGGAMLISHVLFPKLPTKLCKNKNKPNPHIPGKATKIGYYFGMTVARKEDPVLQKRYDEAYMFEYSVNYMTGFMKEKKRGRVWDVRAEYESFLKEFVPKIPSIPIADAKVVKTYLGDFGNVIDHSNPWRTFEQILSDSNQCFSENLWVFGARKLFTGMPGAFIDAKSFKKPLPSSTTSSSSYSGDENLTQIPVTELGSQVPPLRVYSRKRPLVVTTAHRMELESRRRTMPPRKCRKSK